MKKLIPISFTSARFEAIRTSAIALLVALLAGTFWFVASPNAMAQVQDPPVAIEEEGGDCTVCHKPNLPTRETQMYPCNSVIYRRHLAHGDTPAACPTAGSRQE